MHYMHDLKDLLCAELEDYAEKGKKSGKMSMGDLESIHKLTDTVKNILKIDMLEEESGYSENGTYMGEGRIYGTSYDDGMHREGGYSRDEAKDYMMDQIEEMMEMAEKPAEKEALKRCMQALERA